MLRYTILQYSDLHLKLNDSLGIPTADGLTTRVQRKLEQLRKVVDLAIELEVDELNDLGDLFDAINPASKLRNAYAREISRAIRAGIRVVRVTGNHETDGREADGLDAALLTDDLFCVIVAVEKHFRFKNIIYIPELKPEVIVEALNTYPQDMIIGHFGVYGAIYSSGISDTTGLSQSFFSGRPLPVFLGHLHKRQYLFDKQNVIYIGALARANFGDRDIPTGCCIVELAIDEATDTVTGVDHHFIDIPDATFHELKFVEGKSVDDLVPEIDLTPGDIVKVTYEGSHVWYVERQPNKLVEMFKKLGASKILLNYKPVNVENADIIDLQDSDSLDLERWITDRATADNADPTLGVQYYRKAVTNFGS